MSDRHPVRYPPRIYLRTKQREGGNKVVFLLAIKNIALIQGHKLKKEIPRIAYIDMLNGIIPGHALKISWESDQIEGPLLKRYSVASITNQILIQKRRLGIHRGAGIPDFKTKQAKTEIKRTKVSSTDGT